MTSLEPRRPPGLDGLAGSGSRSVLPAWKREILERKRAKLASLGAGPRGLAGGADAGVGVEAAAGITAGAGGECPGEQAPAAERLVLADSLGPLRENPFMRLETERKRQRRGRGAAPGARSSTGRPVQQLLELYSRVPGIRTIRADNILIIESEPGFLPGQRPYEVSPAGPSPNSDPVQQLLARRGCSVAEIRAAEVVIYETPRAAAEAAAQPGRVSRLLEKFDSQLASGESRSRALSPPRRRGSPERSRPLVPKPSAAEQRSSATSPSPPSPGPSTPSVGERAAWFQREQASAAAPSRLSDFLQKTGSNSFTVHPRGLARGGRTVPNGPAIEATPEPHLGPANGLPAVGGPVPSSSSTSKGTDNRQPNAEEEAPILNPSPGPCPTGSANGGPSATPAAPSTFPKHSLASATPSQRRWVFAATSTNDSFEIRPAPKPDMETISDEDVQAKALANLRMNSKNSFVFIPKPRVEVLGSRAGHPVGSKAFEQPKGKSSVSSQSGHLTHIPLENGSQHPQEVVPAYRKHLGGEALQAAEEGDPQKKIATALSEANHKWQGEVLTPPTIERPSKQEPCGGFEISDTSLSSSVTQIPEEPSRPALPVTYIDEVDSDDESYHEAKPVFRLPDAPHYRPHPSLPNSKSEVHYRSNNTFTVVPNRKPATPGVSLSPPNGELYAEEEEEEDQWKGKTLEDPEASHENVGMLLKKRYPTVHEIEVIGGYLSLKKSCLTKIGSSRKKMKISFNEKSLQTTFEYPSESSLVQEEEAEEEEEEASGSEGDEEEKPFAVFLPRATFVNSTVMESATRPPESGSGLSGYTPKHSVEFSKWQEQKYDAGPCEAGASPQKEVMLTPASKNDLSDFRSEPALYF
ncbi:taperin [Trichosurus vulpecula]|uniref:taperin n=1 Tax=Trichosurus vulpecula TaxID=9337 RepID=UPI00186AFD38|nr:taperin [Trichosurus vulpecula]